MKKRNIAVLAICLSFLFVSTASAQMYFGVRGGYTDVKDDSVEVSVPPAPAPPPPEEKATSILEIGPLASGAYFANFDNQWMGAAAVGMEMGNFRTDLEFAYRSGDFHFEGTPYGDRLKTASLMLNGYYGFKTDFILTPFVGAGVGYAMHDLDDTDEDDSVFAYQGTVGVTWAVSETTNLDLAYQYFATMDPEFEVGDASVEADYSSHNYTVGMRFCF